MGRRINDYEFSRPLTWERNHHGELLSEFQRDKLAAWLKVSYEQYREAEAVLRQCRRYLAEAMKALDLLLTPSALGEAERTQAQRTRKQSASSTRVRTGNP